MTPEQFWYDEPRLLDVYVRKRELELDNINYSAWLFGLYSHYGVVVALANAFSKKSSKEITYFEKPLDNFDSSSYKKQSEIVAKEDFNKNYREQYNKWAKLGKKGV